MFRNCGWAAFLASVTLSIAFGTGSAVAGPRPIFACFSPQNAAAIGRLGANDASVRMGFEAGECLALPPGVPLNDVERHGTLWRFRVFGAKPHLYAADWAVGFQAAANEPTPSGFERYLPVTARLLSFGRAYTQCFDDSTKLAKRFEDHERRWKQYLAWSRHKGDNSTVRVTIYVGNEGPRLVAEEQELRRQADQLSSRCSTVASIEADDDFVAFVRTSQQA
jgi:hypothetical protein